MARQLDRLLPPDLVQCLRAHGVSDCGHLFELSDVQLMSICDMSYRDIRLIIADLSAKLISTSVRTAQELLSLRSLGNRYLPTGLQDLDSALGGGLAMGTIVEMCGAPGVGKSQFCLSCCASALLAPPSSSFLVNSVIYIDTELKFSAVRLREIICARSPTSDVNIEMGRINVKRISSVRQLYDCIDALQMEVITTNVALVIIDSIASLARKEGLNEADKEKFILHQGGLLKKLAEQCQCVVLVTNQIMVQDGPDRTEAGDFTAETFSSVMISSSGGGEECWPGVRAEKRLRPTLGTGWYHVVTTRLILAASTRFHSDGGSRAPDDLAVSSGPAWCVGQRYCSIAKSPMCRLFSVPYIIDAKGVVDV